MRLPSALRLGLLVAGLLLAAAPPSRADVRGPVLALSAGGAFGASSGLSRDVRASGLAMGGALQWEWDDRFRFGLGGFGADFGSRVVSVRGLGGSETPQDLGDIETEHRGAWGVGWRVDALGPHAGGWGRSFATVSYEAAWFGADAQGRSLDSRGAMATTVMAGWERPIGAHVALALAAGPTFLTSDRTEHFSRAHLEWRWRP
jgi:hypothetical protein